MIKNYLKLAWRSLTRNKSFSLINIFGLSLGIATSLLILLWVRDEHAVDAFHAEASQHSSLEPSRLFSSFCGMFSAKAVEFNELPRCNPHEAKCLRNQNA